MKRGSAVFLFVLLAVVPTVAVWVAVGQLLTLLRRG